MRDRRQRSSFRRLFRCFLIALTIVAASTLGSGRLSFADFADGLAAYDRGDLRAAHDEWLPLAEAGDLEAQVALAGLLELGGPGLARDLPAAIDWYRRAAGRGDPIAQMNLAGFYAQGRGVGRDRIRALALFSLAAEQGRRWAAEQRDRLSAAMKAPENAQAEALAQQLRAAY